MQVFYKADDGAVFFDFLECKQYEAKKAEEMAKIAELPMMYDDYGVSDPANCTVFISTHGSQIKHLCEQGDVQCEVYADNYDNYNDYPTVFYFNESAGTFVEISNEIVSAFTTDNFIADWKNEMRKI